VYTYFLSFSKNMQLNMTEKLLPTIIYTWHKF
jgi:hypothetical protein